MTEGSTHHEHWFTQGASPFRQGDLLRNVTVGFLPSSFDPEAEVELELTKGDWILLEASCDLDQGRCGQVLVARILPATKENLRAPNEKELNQRLEVMRRGGYVTRFMLSAYPDAGFPLSYVEFGQRAFVPLEYLTRASKDSGVLRLKSPFRESFGNWVGSCFSRIGPENDTLIPPFVKQLHDAHRLRAADDSEAAP